MRQTQLLPANEAAEKLLESMATITEDKRSARMQTAEQVVIAPEYLAEEPISQNLWDEMSKKGFQNPREAADAIRKQFPGSKISERTLYRILRGEKTSPQTGTLKLLANFFGYKSYRSILDSAHKENRIAAIKSKIPLHSPSNVQRQAVTENAMLSRDIDRETAKSVVDDIWDGPHQSLAVFLLLYLRGDSGES